MAAEQFCLRWNNFQSNIASALGSLKAEQDLVDVTLTCGGKSVKAHKVILSACSPYFRAVFKVCYLVEYLNVIILFSIVVNSVLHSLIGKPLPASCCYFKRCTIR